MANTTYGDATLTYGGPNIPWDGGHTYNDTGAQYNGSLIKYDGLGIFLIFYTETIHMLENFTRNAALNKTYTDTIGETDSIVTIKEIHKIFTELLTLSEDFSKTYGRYLTFNEAMYLKDRLAQWKKSLEGTATWTKETTHTDT